MSNTAPYWHIWIDTGGTFTDCLAISPSGKWKRLKVLSSGKLRGTLTLQESATTFRFSHKWPITTDIFQGYQLQLTGTTGQQVIVDQIDFVEGRITLRRPIQVKCPAIFELSAGEEAPVLAARLATHTALDEDFPPIKMRLGTTRGTNALLERKGGRVAFCVTKGLSGLIPIGTQQRPHLFQLDIPEPVVLYEQLFEVPEAIDANGQPIQPLTQQAIEQLTNKIKASGVNAVAIALRNSYRNAQHEQRLAQVLRAKGVQHISASTELSPSVQLLPRAQTALVNAYLSPVLNKYLHQIEQTVGHSPASSLHIMTSAGGLVRADQYQPKDSLLSGPAGGVAGAARIGSHLGFHRLLTLDMGGTSTDTARYDDAFDYTWHTVVGGVELQAPALSIETVAAGGGSICGFNGQKLFVGPQSAGATPGPACYGAGGPLTITDVNLLLGKLDPSAMGIPVSVEAASTALEVLRQQIETQTGKVVSTQVLLRGFEQIANEKMADAIRRISVARGFNPADYALLAFGGAGGLHACQVAHLLGINTVILPVDAGLLSAYGIGTAPIRRIATLQVLKPLSEIEDQLPTFFTQVAQQARQAVAAEGITPSSVVLSRQLLYLRFVGQAHTIELEWHTQMRVAQAFETSYRKLFGHFPSSGIIEVESIKVIASADTKVPPDEPQKGQGDMPTPPLKQLNIQDNTIPVYYWPQLACGQQINGPAIILHHTATAWIEPQWRALVASGGHLIVRHTSEQPPTTQSANHNEVVALELFSNRFTAIAEEMGAQLQRTAFSTNVKERLDFSCALLDPAARLLVNAPHIPVHLGSLGICARLILNKIKLAPGDVVITNHPKYGGSHLPDITLLAPVWYNDQLLGYVINRAHHADIGGKRPGSMPPDARHLAEEGIVIPPMHIVRQGKVLWSQIERVLTQGPWPTRMLRENIADINAALAALRTGQKRLIALAKQEGTARVQHYMERVRQAATNAFLNSWAPYDGRTFHATETLDDGSPICVRINVALPHITFDFSGTAPVHPGNLNANLAILYSVIIYVLRLVCGREVPLNEGLMEYVHIVLPKDTLLHPDFDDHPEYCPPVVGGNTEVSQRLTDTLLKALDLCACSQGTMNNLLFGNAHFGYYETIGGGVGAGPGFHGQSGVHQHMTNTRLTDIEELERRYPVRVRRFELRPNSGGSGQWQGGDGIIRELEFLEPVELTLLTQHRVIQPYGKNGGGPGAVGKQWIIRANGATHPLRGTDTCTMNPGDRLHIETPGGGGWGTPSTD